MIGGTGWRLTMMGGLRGPLPSPTEPLGGGVMRGGRLTREPAELLEPDG